MSNGRVIILASLLLSSVVACSDEEETVPDADSDVTADAADGSADDVASDVAEDATEPDATGADGSDPDGIEPPDGTGADADDATGDSSGDSGTDDVVDADLHDDTTDTVDPGDATADADTGIPGPPAGDCTRDSDCFGGVCLPINGVEGGWLSCQTQPSEADFCPDSGGAFESECCNSTECNGGPGSICVRGPLFYCGGAFPGEYNLCATPACAPGADGGDCAAGSFCLDGGFYREPTALCAPEGCSTHADCTERAGGQCRPFFTECGNRFDGLFCTFDDSPCRSSADCPPAEGFSQVCQWDRVAGESVCVPSIPRP